LHGAITVADEKIPISRVRSREWDTSSGDGYCGGILGSEVRVERARCRSGWARRHGDTEGERGGIRIQNFKLESSEMKVFLFLGVDVDPWFGG
jgi:hypothetical protein